MLFPDGIITETVIACFISCLRRKKNTSNYHFPSSNIQLVTTSNASESNFSAANKQEEALI